MRKEASFQTKFNEYCRTNKLPTAAYELKQCKEYLSFKAVKPHQINALLAAKNGTLCYKIPDDTRSYKPFDSFCLTKTPAYVVIWYECSKKFYAIDVESYIEERENSTRRSLEESGAQKIATFCGYF